MIIYSIGNEIPETGNPIDASWGRKFAEKIRYLDPTRYTTNSMNLLLAGMDILKAMAGGGSEQSGEINTMMNNMADIMAQLMQNPILVGSFRDQSAKS